MAAASRSAIYDWASWQDGQEHLLTRPENFNIPAQQMQLRAHGQARYHGLLAETHCIGANAIRVRFFEADKG